MAFGRTRAYRRGTDSRLWFRMSGPASMTVARAVQLPWKSGINTSTPNAGSRRLRWRMVAAKIAAPPSSRSSRVTEVITTWRRLRRVTASARRIGSPQSTSPGRPVLTSQNPQLRVQVSPSNRNEAVRNSPQHSPIFGQAASSQMVCRFCSRISFLRLLKWGPWLSGTFNQSGRWPITGGAVSGESGSVRRGGRPSIWINTSLNDCPRRRPWHCTRRTTKSSRLGSAQLSVERQLDRFELRLDRAQEFERAGAVENAVVEAEAAVHHRSNGNGIVSGHDRPFDDCFH